MPLSQPLNITYHNHLVRSGDAFLAEINFHQYDLRSFQGKNTRELRPLCDFLENHLNNSQRTDNPRNQYRPCSTNPAISNHAMLRPRSPGFQKIRDKPVDKVVERAETGITQRTSPVRTTSYARIPANRFHNMRLYFAPHDRCHKEQKFAKIRYF